MDELIAFVRAQLDEDERVARAAQEWTWRPELAAEFGSPEHIARWDPARVLAEVEAKRRILDEYKRALDRRRQHPDDLASIGALLALLSAVKIAAQPYARRPGWHEEWRV